MYPLVKKNIQSKTVGFTKQITMSKLINVFLSVSVFIYIKKAVARIKQDNTNKLFSLGLVKIMKDTKSEKEITLKTK